MAEENSFRTLTFRQPALKFSPTEKVRKRCSAKSATRTRQRYSLSAQAPSLNADDKSPAAKHSDDGPQHPTLVCPKCGWDSVKFRKTGRLGCSGCYSTFGEILSSALSNMHRGRLHIGKIPGSEGLTRGAEGGKSMMELLRLQKELENLVKNEEYEEAARVRDRISALKTEVPGAQKAERGEANESQGGQNAEPS
jgi:protein-arginine kinase activator protein McsA